MKPLHSLLVIAHLWLCGVTLNRGEVTVPPVAPERVITVYASKSCRPCYRMHAEIKGHTEYDWRFVYSQHPKWVESVPYIVWRGADGKRYFVSGWEDFETWEAAWQRTQ
jgi:hypothetical protein